jgi:hypothetical protein
MSNNPFTAEKADTTAKDSLYTIQDVPSNPSLAQTATRSSDHPFSPFYEHPAARFTGELAKTDSTTKNAALEHSYSLESLSTRDPSKSSVEHGRKGDKPCAVWPGTKAIDGRRKQLKKSRGCDPLKGMDSKKKMWIKILVTLVVVALGVGLGVGISRAVGGGVWAGSHQKQIPERSVPFVVRGIDYRGLKGVERNNEVSR